MHKIKQGPYRPYSKQITMPKAQDIFIYQLNYSYYDYYYYLFSVCIYLIYI